MILEEIKSTCKYVEMNSKHVKINYNALNDFSKKIDNIKIENWLVSSPFKLLELDTQTIVNFLLIFESIDFSFWGNPKWEIKIDNTVLDGSIALMYCLLKYIKKNGTDLSNLSEEEFAILLKGNTEIPLLNERYKIIKELSKIVKEKMNGNFYGYIKEINIDKKLFEVIIENFPNFKDERIYNNKKIYFYKLAQLLTSDILHIKEIKDGTKVDYSHLVGCADYKIPQVLRGLGILIYDNELSNIIDNNIEIKENSEYEVEIRANMITVISNINSILKYKYNQIDINDYVFMKKKNKLLTGKPYHLTRSINY